ncbi:TrkH family potassium uptake protein [Bhargavaea massiliensis]|uniref:TrkH family potassium uptake protein n=1 Tax=Bhargavaea massiliensis TaxID=2697500 RepID=UPI001BD1330F|nr:TrkH family potassium uptake protein [Bhargavaea massiliensis]
MPLKEPTRRQKFLSSIRNQKLTPARVLVIYYFFAITISAILLNLPGVHRPGVDIGFIDSLFTAVSAVSVTGLSVIDLSATYTTFGIVMFMVVLHFGGIGVMSIGTFFWLLVRRRIGLRERQLIMVDHNQYSMAGAVKLIREIMKIMILIELVGGSILTLYFTKYYESFRDALLNGMFHAVTATTNAGFTINNDSMFPYFNDYFVQLVTMALIILGAIGFPVLIEVKRFLSSKEPSFRFSLFAKITTATFGILLTAGTVVILLIESFHSFKDMQWHEALFAAMFHSVSARSGGLTTMDITQFSEATDVFISFLMFIGASPSSVGGGIRTTTFAIAVLFLINFARGKDIIQIFGREIKLVDVYRSYAVILIAGFLVLVSVMIMSITEKGTPLTALVFEITSAFGTCGMSLGITGDLSGAGKVILMFLMFVGRVGLISFLFTLGGKPQKLNYRFPKERVIIG